MDDLLLKMMRLKLAIGKRYWGVYDKEDKYVDQKGTIGIYFRNTYDKEDIFCIKTLVAIITKMMNRMPIAAKMTRPKGTIGNRQARLYFFSSSLGKEPCHH